MHDDVARVDADQEREERHQFFRTDSRQHLVDAQPCDAAAAGVPVDDRFAERRRSDGLRVGVRIGRRAQGVGDDGGRRVDGRPD